MLKVRFAPSTLLAIVVASSTALVVGIAPSAEATCTGPNRYARAQDYNSEQDQGVKSYMFFKTGSAGDYASGGFIAQVLWEGIQNQPPTVAWIETGSTKGWEGANTYTLYWAWGNNPNGQYHEHKIGAPADQNNQWFNVKLTNPTSGVWKVWYDGSVAINENGNTAVIYKDDYSTGFATGMESTSSSNTMGTSTSSLKSDNLSYLKTNGNWSTDWNTTTHCQDNPPNGDWITSEEDWEDWSS